MKNPFEFYLIAIIPIYILFIIFLGILMFRKRRNAIKSGEVDLNYFKSYQGDSPLSLQVIKNNFENQFQIPVLFFLTCLAAISFGSVTKLTLVIGYSFLISRLIHCYIHLGSNNLRLRAYAYFFGIPCIMFIWIQILAFSK